MRKFEREVEIKKEDEGQIGREWERGKRLLWRELERIWKGERNEENEKKKKWLVSAEKEMKRQEHTWWLNYDWYQISPWSFQEARSVKENSKIHPKMTEMPFVGKEHEDPKKHP